MTRVGGLGGGGAGSLLEYGWAGRVSRRLAPERLVELEWRQVVDRLV